MKMRRSFGFGTAVVPPLYHEVPEGGVFEFPDGTLLPDGWEPVRGRQQTSPAPEPVTEEADDASTS